MSDLTAPSEGLASSASAIAYELNRACEALWTVDYNAVASRGELGGLLEARDEPGSHVPTIADQLNAGRLCSRRGRGDWHAKNRPRWPITRHCNRTRMTSAPPSQPIF